MSGIHGRSWASATPPNSAPAGADYIPLAAGRCDSYGHGYRRCVRDCLHSGRRHLDIDGRVW